MVRRTLSPSPLSMAQQKMGTLHRCKNSTAESRTRAKSYAKIKKAPDSAVPRDRNRQSRRTSDVIASAPPLTLTNNEQLFRTSLTIFPKQVERDAADPRGNFLVTSTAGETRQKETPVRELSREVKTVKNSKVTEVQTSATILSPSPQPTRCFCHKENTTSCHCIPQRFIKPDDFVCGIAPPIQSQVKNTTCGCGWHDFRQKYVDFKPLYDPGRQNLNVTQLACGCVHVSPCTVAPRYVRNENGNTDSAGPAGVTSPPGGAAHGESIGPKTDGFPRQESLTPKPKMMSRMRQLLDRCKLRCKSWPGTGGGKSNASRIPEEAKLVCCQCNCPYLKVKGSFQEEPTKIPGKRKGRCGCSRCVAKRERREKRRINRNAAVEEKPVSQFPERNQEDNAEPKMRIKCQPGNPGNPCRSCRVRMYDLSEELREDLRGKRVDIVNDEKLRFSPYIKKPCEETQVLETSQCPTPFGAPWYSSDSGENADVSESSKHVMHYAETLAAAPEMSLVTSCTFISRINHKTVLECFKKHQRRGKREEARLKPALQDGRDSSVGQKSGCRSNYRQKVVAGCWECETSENQIPLLDIEESGTSDSRPLPRSAFIDPSTRLASSFYKDEQISGSSRLVKGDENPYGSLSKREKSWRESREFELDSPNACSSPVNLVAGSTPVDNQPPRLSSQRSYLDIQKARSSADDETEDSTYASNDGRKVLKPSDESRRVANSEPREEELSSVESLRSNLSREQMITTIFSPRRISTNSSTIGNSEIFARKSQKAHVPANSPVDGCSSLENQELVTPRQKCVDAWCQLPFTPVPCPAKFFAPGSLASRSRAKVNGFLEGEGLDSLDLSIAEERGLCLPSGRGTPLKFPGEERTLFTKGVQRKWERRTSADNKCYLKYCSLRRSGPFSVANEENGAARVTEKEFPVGRRAFSSSGNQRTTILLPCEPLRGDSYARVSP